MCVRTNSSNARPVGHGLSIVVEQGRIHKFEIESDGFVGKIQQLRLIYRENIRDENCIYQKAGSTQASVEKLQNQTLRLRGAIGCNHQVVGYTGGGNAQVGAVFNDYNCIGCTVEKRKS